MKTPTLAPVSIQISPVTAVGGVHVRPLRKPLGMTPRQWKRAWRNPWIGPERRADLAILIQDSNRGLYCGGARRRHNCAEQREARRKRAWMALGAYSIPFTSPDDRRPFDHGWADEE